jgi:hypothetical protein
MKTIRFILAGTLTLLGLITANAILPVPAAQAEVFGRVKARMSRSTGVWEIVNHTNTLAVVQYAVALRGTNDWRTRKPAYVPPNSTRMLGYDINTYDFKIVQVENRPY